MGKSLLPTAYCHLLLTLGVAADDLHRVLISR